MQISQIEQSKRWWDLPTALLLVAAVFTAAYRLDATNWTDELKAIITIALLGVSAGLALGQSEFDQKRVRVFAIVFGLYVIVWQITLQFGIGWTWREAIFDIFNRLFISFERLLRLRAVTDPVLFVLLMAIMFWSFTCYAGYHLVRHASAWRATLPLGLAIFIIHIHDPYYVSRSWLLAAYIFLALMLLSRISFLHKQVQWKSSQTHLPPNIGLDLLRVTVLAGALLILFSWTAPAMAANIPPARQAWQKIAKPWYDARAQMTNAFASLQASVGVVQDYYGDIQPLGRGNNLTDQIIMLVKAPVRVNGGIRYYWVGRTYDLFDGASWQASEEETLVLSPESFNLASPTYSGRLLGDFTFITSIPMRTVYIPGHLDWFSRPVDAKFIPNSDGTVDLLSIRATPNIKPGDIYDAKSHVTNTTITALNSAGDEYPAWVTERYLQLPDSVTPRTRELALEITEGLETPYEKVVAVTNYLRNNLEYVETIDPPPANQDIIDWILFDTQKGFCNYYATSEVVLLRSLGIPTRIAFGYAQGERDLDSVDPATNTVVYTVRQKDAHAWPEIYFPGIGWVEFEPTVNQSPLRRPAGDPDQDNAAAASIFDEDTRNEFEDSPQERLNQEPLDFDPEENSDLLVETGNPWATLLWFLIPGLAIVGVTISKRRAKQLSSGALVTPVAVQLERNFQRMGLRPPNILAKWSTWAKLPVQAQAYTQINKTLKLLGTPPAAHLTPAERAQNLITLLPSSQNDINILLKEYQFTIYASTARHLGRNRYSLAASQRAAREVRKQGWRSRLAKLLSRVGIKLNKQTS